MLLKERSGWRNLLIAGGGVGPRCFGDAQIAGGAGLGDFIYHKFKRRVASASVEEDRFIHGTILLLEILVVGKDIGGVLIFLGIGIFQLDGDDSDFLRAAFASDGEFKI